MNLSVPTACSSASARRAKLCLVLGLIIFLVGLAELLVAGFFLKSTYEEAQTWPRATATVSELVARLDSDGSLSSYYPRFTFTAQDGQSYTALGSVGSRPARHKVGDVIEVIYPADNPAKAEISDAFDLYFLPGAFALMGMVEGFLGAVLMLIGTALRRRENAPTRP